ncbi:MAG: rRNA pseudouridine synthase [Gammaproteobacteria bacterium]|nr:rRNA pseudouridine synthase [Gammaproteobacteria bacterium]
MLTRLNKLLAHNGFGSRRTIDELLAKGQVRVNGEVASVGQSVSKSDSIVINGSVVSLQFPEESATLLLMYHKPKGQLCSHSDKEERDMIYAHLPPLPAHSGRWVSVGRLDYQTSGLLLLTNDGAFADALAHPRSGCEREYLVKVRGIYDSSHPCWRQGVTIGPGEVVKPKRVECLEQLPQAYWVRIVLTTGYYRGVRRFFEKIGHSVVKLQRTRYSVLSLDHELEPGQWRYCTDHEIVKLKQLVVFKGNKV